MCVCVCVCVYVCACVCVCVCVCECKRGVFLQEFRSIALASFNDKEAFGKYTQIVDEEASELV